MNKRILFITSIFQPEPNHLKNLNFLKDLVARGHDVRVLTGFPNYPGGTVYSGYKIKWTHEEVMDGIRVTRVAMYPSHDRSALKRSINFLSLGFSMIAHTLLLKERFDICYVYLGPITLMWPAVWLKWRQGTRIIADVQDIWPESVSDSGMLQSGFLLKAIEAMTKWSYSRADRIVVLSPAYKKTLVDRGYRPECIDVIYNWADEDNTCGSDESIEQYFETGCFNLVYSGNMGKLQGLDTVLDAMKILLARGSRSRIVFVGGGVEYNHLVERIKNENISNAAVYPFVPSSKVKAIQKKADMLFLHLERTPLTRIGIPQKIQAYLVSGKPVLAAVEGEGARIISESKCGLTCDPADPMLLAETILKAESLTIETLAEMGRAGYAYYKRAMNYGKGLDEIEKTISILSR